jgi:hypothetical protein
MLIDLSGYARTKIHQKYLASGKTMIRLKTKNPDFFYGFLSYV